MQKMFPMLTALVCASSLFSIVTTPAADAPLGYKDTPLIPGTPWHVHDPDRPRPHVVITAPTFSHNASAPSDAVALFDGKDLSKWRTDKGTDPTWKVENGYMEVAGKSGNIFTRDEFESFQLHLEFATPTKVEGNSQGRGNSGIFIHGVFEVQVLDSYENPTYPDGQLGGLYGQTPPLANPAKKPGEWQCYDIIFAAPKFDTDGKLTQKAAVTVILNGVVLHHRREYTGNTPHKENGSYKDIKSSRGVIGLQDHGNPMRFRNIWIRPLGEYDKP